MAKKKRGQGNPASKALILLVVFGVPLLFVLAAIGTKTLATVAPILVVAVIIVAIGVYSGITSGLLYDFYEVGKPWYRFVPCYGELTIMDSKFLHIGTIFYIVALAFLVLSRLPYSVLKIVGENLAISLPFYFTVLAFIGLAGVQVIKGLGILDCTKTIAAEWEERMHTSVGFIKSFVWLGFIPFVRVIAVYGLNKPLSTLVTFNDITISDSNDIVLSEEESADM